MAPLQPNPRVHRHMTMSTTSCRFLLIERQRCSEYAAPRNEAIPKKKKKKRKGGGDDGLSGLEWTLYSILFLFSGCLCVIVSSVLYYVWRDRRPTRAGQINKLGFIICGINIVLGILVQLDDAGKKN